MKVIRSYNRANEEIEVPIPKGFSIRRVIEALFGDGQTTQINEDYYRSISEDDAHDIFVREKFTGNR